jgi:hypothetical protein
VAQGRGKGKTQKAEENGMVSVAFAGETQRCQPRFGVLSLTSGGGVGRLLFLDVLELVHYDVAQRP